MNDYSNVQEPARSASVHGMITSISRVKRAKQSGNEYFDGEVCDSKGKLRFVGFSTSQQEQLENWMQNKRPVALNNCQIKPGLRDSSKMELVIKGSTKLCESPKKFNVAQLEYKTVTPTEITLLEVDSTSEYDLVSTTVKVISCEQPFMFPGGKQKQDLVVDDRTGTATITLWEQNVGMLERERCYKLTSWQIKEYGGKKYLGLARDQGSETSLLSEDIEVTKCADQEATEKPISNPAIVAVLKLETFKSCLRCQGRVEPESPPLGRCSKPECGTLQRFDICNKSTVVEI